jgi:tRNA-dihydrouridine synthase B
VDCEEFGHHGDPLKNKKLLESLSLGSLTLPHRVFYAPLAGCSDFAFRQITSGFRPALVYCEMVKMDALVRNDPHTYHLLDYDVGMHPIGAQLCGSKPQLAAQCARIIEELGFDTVDLNCGCPVDKVTKDGSGSGLLKNPQLIGEILTNMISAVKIPVTVKIRAGWDEDSIVGPEVTRIAEEVGAKLIYVHGRTREQGYKGPANWDYIKDCVDAAKTIPVVGNGDVVDYESAMRMLEVTGCDGVLVSRATMGQPWVVQDILKGCRDEAIDVATDEYCRLQLEKHMEKVLKYHQGRRGLVDLRRIGCWYLKKSPHTREFRDKISRIESLDAALDLVKEVF